MQGGTARATSDWVEFIWIVPLTAAILASVLAADMIGAHDGVSTFGLLRQGIGDWIRLLVMLIEIVVLVALVAALTARSESPLRHAGSLLMRQFGGSAQIVAARCAPLLLMPILFAVVGAFKTLLGHRIQFQWDDDFAEMGRDLLFGQQAWEFTHALLGPAATIFLDRIYTLWVPLLPIAVLGFAIFAPRIDRARFFVAFVATWILLGIVGAFLGASAGPCFAADIGAANASSFRGLMERLHALRDANGVELGAVAWQRLLWQAHVQRDVGIGMGISAMPSLHNAICALYVLAFAKRSRPLAIAAGVFAFLIFVGSIHLGWHYPVDGIIAYPAVAAIWWAAGWYLRRTGYVAAVLAEASAKPPIRVAPAASEIPATAFAAGATVASLLDIQCAVPPRIGTLEPQDVRKGASTDRVPG